MNTSEYLRTGDAVNVIVSKHAYPFSYDANTMGASLAETNHLQGRVLFADALGVCIVTNGGLIMPSSNTDNELLPKPDADEDRGEYFPWAVIHRVSLLSRSDAYDHAWLVKFAEEEVFADCNEGAYPQSQREYIEWTRTVSQVELAKRVADIVARDVELSR